MGDPYLSLEIVLEEVHHTMNLLANIRLDSGHVRRPLVIAEVDLQGGDVNRLIEAQCGWIIGHYLHHFDTVVGSSRHRSQHVELEFQLQIFFRNNLKEKNKHTSIIVANKYFLSTRRRDRDETQPQLLHNVLTVSIQQ